MAIRYMVKRGTTGWIGDHGMVYTPDEARIYLASDLDNLKSLGEVYVVTVSEPMPVNPLAGTNELVSYFNSFGSPPTTPISPDTMRHAVQMYLDANIGTPIQQSMQRIERKIEHLQLEPDDISTVHEAAHWGVDWDTAVIIMKASVYGYRDPTGNETADRIISTSIPDHKMAKELYDLARFMHIPGLMYTSCVSVINEHCRGMSDNHIRSMFPELIQELS